jgi:hypothetical protein
MAKVDLAGLGRLELQLRALLRDRNLLDTVVLQRKTIVVPRLYLNRRTPDGALRSIRITPLEEPERFWPYDILWSINHWPEQSECGDGRSPGDSRHALVVVEKWLCDLVPWREIPRGMPLPPTASR